MSQEKSDMFIVQVKTIHKTQSVSGRLTVAHQKRAERYANEYDFIPAKTAYQTVEMLPPHRSILPIKGAAGIVRGTTPSQQDGLSELTRRGLDIYEQRLRLLLEPRFSGQVVAIHVDTQDYEVAPSSGAAMRAIRKRQPTGQLLLHTIGVATDTGLAARMLGTQIVGRAL